VLYGLIGAKLIESNSNFRETIKFALSLLNANKREKFPFYGQMRDFYVLWMSKDYTRNLKLHHEVKIKDDKIYYEAYI
jgi:hypothetical protein